MPFVVVLVVFGLIVRTTRLNVTIVTQSMRKRQMKKTSNSSSNSTNTKDHFPIALFLSPAD